MGFSKEEYDAYLLSEHWKTIREAAFNRVNRRCEACAGKARHGHHLLYRVPLSECTSEDIMALCERCHDLWHKWLKEQAYKVTAFCRQSTRGAILALIRPLRPAPVERPAIVPSYVPINGFPEKKKKKVKIPKPPKLPKDKGRAKRIRSEMMQDPHFLDIIQTSKKRDEFKKRIRNHFCGRPQFNSLMSNAFVLYHHRPQVVFTP